ncbi:prophage endopeptidase [Pseudomonas asplenii]|uniref:Prophage endopeptidase n=1 Tax=Pseudomonas asplenii TaxID=53407 RepID=A0A1H1NG82_9PSED|nr:lysis system i-spanin subunit Rz [Pseudomonas asplenii]SDR97954.1 prophage endopeptidase [Pseudomonas asplenii]
MFAISCSRYEVVSLAIDQCVSCAVYQRAIRARVDRTAAAFERGDTLLQVDHRVEQAGYMVLALALIGAGAGAAWEWQANAYGKRLAEQGAAYQADLSSIATAGAAQARQAVEQQQVAQKALADLDAKSTQEKADALAKNDLLRRLYGVSQTDNEKLHADVASGQRRLRIAAACSVASSGSVVPQAASASGLGDAASVELAPTAGQTVFDIRARIIADQAALRALQAYVREVCQ